MMPRLALFEANKLFGGVAQSVEQRDHNPRVGGSIPSAAIMQLWKQGQDDPV